MTYPKKKLRKDILIIIALVIATIGLLALVDDTEGSIWAKTQMEYMDARENMD